MKKSKANVKTETKAGKHLGIFIGGYLTEEQAKRIESVEKKFDEIFGDVGRNRTRALRYIVDNFDENWVQKFPKGKAVENKAD